MPGILCKGMLVPGQLAVDLLRTLSLVLQQPLTSPNLAVQFGVEVGEPRSKAEGTDLLRLSDTDGVGYADSACCDSILGLKRPRSWSKLGCGGQHRGWHRVGTMLWCVG